ncbi:endonuclease domain-containing protein [Cylindrospermum sp. FACHB-282]|uniref:endonuclease domain-containing protein n=1 Tax=Cylindrospermum sp. FACHB-282 TaxID=2692794 RepID=UPI001687DA62|nr:endonuclease domain-containing protein [Cylindrospermum sp. FACHB-282]MBD2386477.1 endonuclease domain-containing protein [Cylindrospermum sp. FACHB-282]
MTELFNRTEDIEKRRRLRQNSTAAEGILWQHLRNRKLQGYKFRRQYGIDRFVVDFYCPETHLAIELDGSIHDIPEIAERDRYRQAFITAKGIHFLRFRNEEISDNLPNVLQRIITTLQSLSCRPLI